MTSLARVDVAPDLGAARTRLCRLGYHREDSGSLENDESLLRAVRVFQCHAGLTVDGHVGRDTWAALQELTTVTAVPDLTRWAARDEDTGLLRRAVALRLQALGLLEKRTWCKQAIRVRLATFVRLAGLLRLTEGPLPKPEASMKSPRTLATLAVLFDSEGIKARLAAHEGRFADPLSEEDAASVARFVAHVGNLEL